MRSIKHALCLFSIFGCMIFSIPINAQSRQPELLKTQSLRDTLYQLVNNAEDSPALAKWMAQQKPLTPLQLSYLGTFKALSAKIIDGPFNKLAALKEGEAYLDLAVSQEPETAEIRFLRFCVESQLPRFLVGFYDHEEEDRSKILALLPHLDKDTVNVEMQKYIINFMRTYGKCNAQELILIEQIISPN